MKLLQILGITFLFALTGVSTALSAGKPWDTDKAHSNIYFSVDHIFSKVNGHFNDFKVEITFDPADLAGSTFNFEIMTGSIDTNIAKRDKHLQSADFFDAKNYPAMKFTSTQVSDAGNEMYNVAGKLSVKGKDYDLTLPVKLEGLKEHPAKKGTEVVGFNAALTLDRLAHNIGDGKFYDMGIVGKDVNVFVSLELLSAK